MHFDLENQYFYFEYCLLIFNRRIEKNRDIQSLTLGVSMSLNHSALKLCSKCFEHLTVLITTTSIKIFVLALNQTRRFDVEKGERRIEFYDTCLRNCEVIDVCIFPEILHKLSSNFNCKKNDKKF